MAEAPFILADRVRAESFRLLGRTRRFFDRFDIHADSEGLTWAIKRVESHVFAFTWLGHGWLFDPYAARIWADKRSACFTEMRQASEEIHRRELDRVLQQLRLGSHSERLLWFIHQQVIQARSSVIQPADFVLAAAVWGRDRDNWPRQWRQDLSDILQGLAWLHVAEGPNNGVPSLGMNTALLTHVANLRGHSEDKCAGQCPEHISGKHHHYLINIGRGFLGLLEQFARENPSGIRSYEFPVTGPRDAGLTLRRAGKTGRLISIYLPAKLGDPASCRRLTARQHQFLQALVRETTRQPRHPRQHTAEVARFAGNTIPKASGRGRFQCSVLNADMEYAGFNGNGKRAGLGYYLTTAGGWLKKAGYAPDQISAFLADLSVLQAALNLTVVGIEKSSNRCHDLERLRDMAAAAALHATLQRILVRVYTRADYAERWNQFFHWGDIIPELMRRETEDLLELVAAMRRQGISHRTLADGIDVDPSFLSKLFNGKKRWPAGLLARCRTWLDNRREEAGRLPATAWPTLPTLAEGTDCLLDVALAYRERGWSVVPQRPGDKKPTIRWKPYQEVLPSSADLQSWFRQWPSAGLAVVLGPVSDLFVIDVDGPEAHTALMSHLGEEPSAPKAISGSRKPHRFHLFFRCPDDATKAKATPWHPQLEFRGQGGIVVIPPSLHKSGHRYAWVPGRSPADVPLPEVPGPILATLRKKTRSCPTVPVPVPDSLEVSPSTRRFLAGRYAEGPRWNDRLFQAACDLAGRSIPQETAEPLLLAGARPWNEAEREKALRTICSAYNQTRVPGMY
jgi:hypothetical protein